MSKIKISKSPLKLMKLGDDIAAKHEADGASSKLNEVDIAAMKTNNEQARILHDEALALRRQSEKKTEAYRKLLGIHKTQRSKTEGTVLFYVYQSRDVLKGIFRAAIRKLGDWGFTVDDTSSSKPENGETA